MKNLTKKRTLFYGLFLLMSFHVLRAAKSFNQPYVQPQKDHTLELTRAKRKILIHGYCRAYNIPTDLFLFVTYFVHDNPLQYKNQPLPLDLSGQDLSGYDFTGCAFTYTNLAYTELTNVILTNTTCDYQKAFVDNSKKNRIQGGRWYQSHLPKDLKRIAEIYPKLNNDTHKAKLLHIACGLSRLPFYEGIEFYIKVYYWSCTLLHLKQSLSNPYGDQLLCSLQENLENDANDDCWTTNYPQDRVSINAKPPHTNFAQYLKDFKSGLTNYQCSSIYSLGFNWYKDSIIKSIKGLATTYPNIKEQKLQQEAYEICHALSKSYQVQKRNFQHHYIVLQHRLMQLKKSIGVKVKKNKVHYSGRLYREESWSRGEK